MLRSRREWLFSKAPLQILALLFAILAWVLVNSGQTVQQRRSIRLQYVQVPRDLIFQKNPIKEVKVDLTGSLYRLRGIPDDDLIYSVDLSAARPGMNRVELELDSLRLPFDIEATHLNPRSFNVYLEEMSGQSLKLKPMPLGRPKDGFQVGTIKVKPDVISVIGPKSVLSKLTELEVEVNLSNRELSFSETIKPRLSFPNAESLEPVLVEVEILPQTAKREYPFVSVTQGSEKGKVRITPNKAKVILEGGDSDLRVLESRLEVTVPVDGLKRGRYRLRGQVSLPPRVKLISVEPESFLVEVLQEGAQK